MKVHKKKMEDKVIVLLCSKPLLIGVFPIHFSVPKLPICTSMAINSVT